MISKRYDLWEKQEYNYTAEGGFIPNRDRRIMK